MPIKMMDLAEFRRIGFLQEANRQFFHPLGLALEVIVNDDGDGLELGGIWDYRDDPEGMEFDESVLSREKACAVAALRSTKADARMARLGSVVQPIP